MSGPSDDLSVPDIAEGPYFDELTVGQVFAGAPGVTLTSGLVMTHDAIVGQRLPLVLDAELASEVTGEPFVAPPALVWDLAIGQSTVATHHVKANLFYRGLVLYRMPVLGDTLRTTTEVVGLRQNHAREGRAPTGLAALRITTVDQRRRRVLDFWRCAMLPLREPGIPTGHVDDLDSIGDGLDRSTLATIVKNWRIERFIHAVEGPRFGDIRRGQSWCVGGRDVVSNDAELARLTLNMAKVHHDSAAAGGTRLVYGGHTVGIALAQATRALPTIVTVLGWHSCDHTGPVREGDTLRSTLSVEDTEPMAVGGGMVHLRSQVYADDDRLVLDWRYVVVLA